MNWDDTVYIEDCEGWRLFSSHCSVADSSGVMDSNASDFTFFYISTSTPRGEEGEGGESLWTNVLFSLSDYILVVEITVVQRTTS